MIFFTKV